MRINNIRTSNQSFGYNKKLNEQLKKELKSCPDKELATALYDMNTYCNQLEDNIRKTEKVSYKKPDNDCVDILVATKQLLAGYVACTFEDLNYGDREYTHYYNEYVKNGRKNEDWRFKMCKELGTWTSDQRSPDAPKKSETKESSIISDVPKSSESSTNNDSNSKKTTEEEHNTVSNTTKHPFMEKFVPDETTPSGFDDVSGMDDLKKDLVNGIIQYIKDPEQAQADMEDYGKKIPKALLLYGPPGCGKTYITQALSSEIDVPLYLLNISNVGSQYINLTSKNLKTAFDAMSKIGAESDKPCVVFMDEIDSLGFERSDKAEPEQIKQIATMLQGLDSARKSNVIIIGATNKYDLLDPALRRRFDSKVFVDIPDEKSRKALLQQNLKPLKKGQKLLGNEECIEQIAKKLDGYSNSSVCKISYQAAMNALERNRSDIELQDYDKAIAETTEEKPDRKAYMKSDKAKESKKIGFGAAKTKLNIYI